MLRGLLLLLMLLCKIVQNGHSNLSILFCKFGYFYSAINNDKKCKAIRSDIIKVGNIELKFDNPDIYQLEELIDAGNSEGS